MSTNLVKEDAADALLRSISHNLRTPLTSIRGALSYLQQSEVYRTDASEKKDGSSSIEGPSLGPQLNINPETRHDLIGNAVAEAELLNRYIGNLLDMAHLESGTAQFTLAPCAAGDLIGSALDLMGESLRGRRVQIRIAADLPPVPMDFTWMLKALVHVLDNAARYSPPGSPIHVRAISNGADLEISVADRGVGLSPEDRTRVFEKFYRVGRPERATGTGVGLAICKEILAGHGGTVRAARRKGGGTVVTMTLPLETPRSE